MTNSLEVLVLESHPHAGDGAASALAAAGHVVRRCHDDGSGAFPCVGLTEPARCPLTGGVDVAVDVRTAGDREVTAFEDGVACALREGVPVIEVADADDGHGSPFGGWTLPAAATELSDACTIVVSSRFAALEAAVVERVAPLASANGVDGALLSCAITRRGRGLHIVIRGPEAPVGLRQAMSVRAFGIVRDATRAPHDEVSIAYQTDADRRP